MSVVKHILLKKKSSITKTKPNRLMLLSNSATCGKKKLTFIKDTEKDFFLLTFETINFK